MPFKKGESGNQKGRPQGTGWRQILQKKLQKHGGEIVDKLIKQATEGDPQALNLCISRMMPPIRPTDTPITIKLVGDAHARSETIISELSKGKITPIQAQALMTILKDQMCVIEVAELMDRIDGLESRLPKND